MTFSAKLLRYPPILCRLLARDRHRALTSAEIARRGDLSLVLVEAFSTATSWDDFHAKHITAFSSACGIDFDSRTSWNRVECYFRKNRGNPKFEYLTSAPNWKTYYLPLIIGWRKSLTTVPHELPTPIRRLLVKLGKQKI